MTVALSSLRVVTEGDSSSYVKSMADVATANDSATVRRSTGSPPTINRNAVAMLSATALIASGSFG